ncbi:MAG: polysaccharide biosynthesis tyrosine autokinase [Leptolyngbyaceae cyanobacterium bins.302]|nr:polysaccharide biosynthesis tyrosine autokinase [Leptolyngbyaceae cyanobacterium bins.302]
MQATQNTSIITPENEAGYGQLLGVLLRRRFWVLGGLVVAVAIAALYTLRQESTYLSGMQLLVEPNYQGKKEGSQMLENEFSDPNKVQVDTATQISLMQSSALLRRAMELLQNQYPEFNPDDPGQVVAFKAPLKVGQLSSGEKKTDSATKIFQVTYVSNDPVKTQDILKALQKVYLDYNREQQQQRLTRGLSFVNQQLPQIKGKLKDAEAALESFRVNQELINPETQAQFQAEILNKIRQEQQTNLIQLRELRSRYAAIQRQLALSPEEAVAASRLSQSNRYQILLNEIQKTDLQLVQQRLRFKDGTPFVQQLSNQRQRQLGLLQTEVQRVLGANVGLANRSGDGLLATGQLGGLDLSLVGQFVENQVSLQAAESRALSLASYEQQLRTELQRFPRLLAQYGRLQPEVDLTRDTLKQLLKAQQDIGLEIARGGFDWQVVEEPLPGGKTGPDMRRNLLLGAVAGLFLGGLAAFAREAMDDAVRSSDDLKKQVPVPLLGMVPALVSEVEEDAPLLNLPFNKSRSLTSATNQVLQWQPFRESLDLLYQNVQLLSMDSPLKSLVVTSALAGEGKSTIILGLAISAARLHQRVLLIDADLRRPSLHKLLNLPNDQGLSTLLTSHTALPQQLPASNGDLRSNISVITAGPTPTDPAKLLSSQRMREMMITFEQSYDLVLLDAPPVLGMVDAMVLGMHSKGVLMVGRLDRVTRSELTQATTMLKNLNIVGVVANGVPRPNRSSSAEQRK